MKLLTPTLVLLFLLFTFSYTQAAMKDSVPAGFCGSKCKVRCSKASVQDRCLKYCGICCATCKCVPSGTYGNKDQCPCYRDMLSSKGRPKCP
ncbi:Snakin-1 [Acorus calamus]|uniref:Snakin-1 n=1 Tax=Acorus calamus TaxID=4465 RepID=A0AAV9FEI3_ACOCL|nr:Snakin-1 [Acorus calamus]